MTDTLLFATRSPGKQREIREILGQTPWRLAYPDEIGLRPEAAESTIETGDTFEGNALRKAEYFSRRAGLPTVAEDSGLEVIALGGLPGVRSRRFAEARGNQDEANNAELRRRLGDAPAARRRARYRCAVVYLARPDAVPQVFEAACNGTILLRPRGAGGFGYDPLFLSDELGKTFAEAAPAEKHAVSHRGRALRALMQWLAAHPPD